MSFPPVNPSIVNVSVSKVKLLSELIADASLPVNKAFDVKVVAPVPPFDTGRVPVIKEDGTFVEQLILKYPPIFESFSD